MNYIGLDIHKKNTQACVKDISESSGFSFRPHDMRRTFGHRLWLQGVPIETIATLMRHESSGTTFKAYIGVIEDILSAAMDKLVPSAPSQSTY